MSSPHPPQMNFQKLRELQIGADNFFSNYLLNVGFNILKQTFLEFPPGLCDVSITPTSLQSGLFNKFTGRAEDSNIKHLSLCNMTFRRVIRYMLH